MYDHLTSELASLMLENHTPLAASVATVRTVRADPRSLVQGLQCSLSSRTHVEFVAPFGSDVCCERFGSATS